MPEHTKEELIDAAVAVVERRVAAMLRVVDNKPGPGEPAGDYVEAYHVASALQEQGLITHEHIDSTSSQWRDQARKSLEGKVKRLLDAEAAKPDARILRFSSVKDGPLPHLDGWRRTLYTNAVGYTTPELYRRAEAAVEARIAQEKADAETMAALLEQAASVGLPKPIKHDSHTVIFDVAGLRELVRLAEEAVPHA